MLKIEELHVHYGCIHALKGVSLSVHEGEIVAIIGSNGAGKSTLLKTISGILKARKGTMQYLAFDSDRPLSKLHESGDVGGASGRVSRDKREGRNTADGRTRDIEMFRKRSIDLVNLAPHHIVSLGISQAPEGRLIFQNMTVRENLALGAYQRKDRQGIKEDEDFVFSLFPRLKERLAQSGGTLSGGEQQMLSIARALMARPRLLLLDEPSLGIAPTLVQQIFACLKTINQKGTTILLVEQDSYLALKTSHRAYVIETGNIVLEGKSAQLLHHPEVKKAYFGE
ncbi:MAG: hypothetical protein A3I05_04080 [Deltaproteobacteria bacterium RIFCSPLOWO2_02_FULL_44_10]|nr:MAG: hypothetical protein A3C46_03770 [Deltaproteobacteria bacterium RIFCSPHIGHO2_02_FULL_44_16]OGQ46324.1 MAG: hypothetical protein A3I05_04080 [Deltaproteobacteria bacterium RIFCSPLOWO2_02_FULL_44_10]